MSSEGLKNLKGVVSDIVDGFITVNPLYLKKFKTDELTALYQLINRKQLEIRTEIVSLNDIASIRIKNMRLQRINTAINTISYYLKSKKISPPKDDTNKKKRLKDIGI